MKWMPEGKSHLIWILVVLWLVLIAEYSIYPLWLKLSINQGIIAADVAEQRACQQKIAWLGNVNKTPNWPKGWTITNEKDKKGLSVIEAKGPISKRAWQQWLDDLYVSPVPITIESCQLRRLSPSQIFVTIRFAT